MCTRTKGWLIDPYNSQLYGNHEKIESLLKALLPGTHCEFLKEGAGATGTIDFIHPDDKIHIDRVVGLQGNCYPHHGIINPLNVSYFIKYNSATRCCTHCWKAGHTASQCPIKSGTSNSPPVPAACPKCYEIGHRREACTITQEQCICSLCHKKGHSAYQCVSMFYPTFAPFRTEMNARPARNSTHRGEGANGQISSHTGVNPLAGRGTWVKDSTVTVAASPILVNHQPNPHIHPQAEIHPLTHPPSISTGNKRNRDRDPDTDNELSDNDSTPRTNSPSSPEIDGRMSTMIAQTTKDMTTSMMTSYMDTMKITLLELMRSLIPQITKQIVEEVQASLRPLLTQSRSGVANTPLLIDATMNSSTHCQTTVPSPTPRSATVPCIGPRPLIGNNLETIPSFLNPTIPQTSLTNSILLPPHNSQVSMAINSSDTSISTNTPMISVQPVPISTSSIPLSTSSLTEMMQDSEPQSSGHSSINNYPHIHD
jgi:hypothetical protein